MSPLIKYEIKAEAFRLHSFGMLAPGKDQCDDAHTDEEREDEWKKFQADYGKAFEMFFYAANRILFLRPRFRPDRPVRE